MESQLSYFKSQKMMLWKCCTQYASKFGKLSSGHRTGKGQFFILIPKKGNAKECSNYLTIALISHTSKVMLKFSTPGFNSMWTVNFRMYKLDLENAEKPDINLPTSTGSSEKQVQFSSIAQSCPTLWDPMNRSMPGLSITNSWSLLKLMSIELVMPTNYLILCHPLLLLPSIFPSIRVFSKQSVLRTRCWVSALASVLPMNIQDWSPLGWTGLILQSKGISRVFSNTTVQKHQFFGTR